MGGLSIPVKLSIEDLFTPGVGKAIRKVQELTDKVTKPLRVQVDTNQAQNALSGVMGLVGKLGLATATFAGAKQIVQWGADLEQTRVQFETFTGSAEKGNQVIAQLQKFAQITPFDDNEVIGAGRSLLAFGEDAKSLMPILTKLGNITSATPAALQDIVSIYGKNKLSGIIQSDDLNQLNNNGIPVMKSLAAQLGVNISQVRKMAEQSKITFPMLDKAFDELGGKGGKWGDLMQRQSETFSGRLSSLVGFAQNLGGKLGEVINPFLGKLLDGGNSVLTFVQQNTQKIKDLFAPIQLAVQPLLDTFERLFQQQYGNADAGSVLATAFNRVGKVIQLVSPFVKVSATLLGTVWEQGQRVVNVLSKFWGTSPRLQKFFSGLYTGALAAFKGIAEAVGKYLGGTATFIEGIFTGDLHKIGDGLKTTLAAFADTQDIGKKSALGFVKGWHEGLPTSNIFAVKAGVKAAGGSDAASAFMGSKAAAKAPALTAAASKGITAGGVSGVGGKGITNITLRVDSPFRNTTINVHGVEQGAKQTATLFRDWFMAELNDVNTLDSAN